MSRIAETVTKRKRTQPEPRLFARTRGCFCACADSEFLENVSHVNFHCAHAEEESTSNFVIRQSLTYQVQDLLLPAGECAGPAPLQNHWELRRAGE
jgi:hypothetical protein